jgi:hypothetical protein
VRYAHLILLLVVVDGWNPMSNRGQQLTSREAASDLAASRVRGTLRLLMRMRSAMSRLQQSVRQVRQVRQWLMRVACRVGNVTFAAASHGASEPRASGWLENPPHEDLLHD